MSPRARRIAYAISGALFGSFAASFLTGLLYGSSVTRLDVSVMPPLAEETCRLIALSVIAGSLREKGDDITSYEALIFGLVWGGLEAAPRFVNVFWSGEAITPVAVLGPIAPFMMHTFLSLVMARLVVARKPVLAWSTCAAIHGVHNGTLVYLIDPLLVRHPVIDIIARLNIYWLAIKWARGWWRRSPPPDREPLTQ